MKYAHFGVMPVVMSEDTGIDQKPGSAARDSGALRLVRLGHVVGAEERDLSIEQI